MTTYSGQISKNVVHIHGNTVCTGRWQDVQHPDMVAQLCFSVQHCFILHCNFQECNAGIK